MEALDKIGGLSMEAYRKPFLVAQDGVIGIVPLAAVGAAVAGMSAAQLAGVATVAGLAYGMAASSGGGGSHELNNFRSKLVLQ